MAKYSFAAEITFNDHERDFETLLQNNNDVCHHHRNIQTLFIEIFKIKKGFASLMMRFILKGRNQGRIQD